MSDDLRVLVPVRWSDMDANGHVNNARVATLIEDARLRWRAHVRRLSGLGDFVEGILIASLHVDFRHPIQYGPDLEVGVSVAAVGRSSYTLAYRGCQSGVDVFEAVTVQVFTQDEAVAALRTGDREQLLRMLPHREASDQNPTLDADPEEGQ